LSEPAVFKAHLAALRKVEWVVDAKPPFGGPDAVLAYLSRYTHAVSSLEAFRTPASVHPLAPATGRRPKTLDETKADGGRRNHGPEARKHHSSL
jgi:hypothetical protein